MKALRLYIAGPMTGYEQYNFPAFDAMRDELRSKGHLPISPADLDRAIGFDPNDPCAVEHIAINKTFTEFAIRRDVDAILQCDGIVMLPGWEKSRGARGEKGVAEWLGITIFLPGDEIPCLNPAHNHAA